MTTTDLNQLKPIQDYLINGGQISKFICKKKWDEDILIIERNGQRYSVPAEECYLLGEYRGCFGSDVLPPMIDEKWKRSDRVIVTFLNDDDEKEVGTGFYNYQYKMWHFCLPNPNDYPRSFKWCFKPDYLTF